MSHPNVFVDHLRLEDYVDLSESMSAAYGNSAVSPWSFEQIERLLKIFPKGQFCLRVDDKVVGCALALIIDSKKLPDKHSFSFVTGNDTFSTHCDEGDILYGIEVFVHPKYRNLRLGRRLYDTRKELCEELNLKCIMFGGRIPGYQKYSEILSTREYISKVRLREIDDPVLNFQLTNDFQPVRVIKGYLEGDEHSQEYAVLFRWENVNYEDGDYIALEKEVIRVGLVQWQMRSFEGLPQFFDQMEFFVDCVARYKADFGLFPQFFNAPLMAPFDNCREADAIRKLAEYTIPIRDKGIEFAVSYNVNLILGSMPYLEDGFLYNAGYLCRRDGSFEQYRKLHITPGELNSWGMMGGNSILAFDTDCGKIGILVCYDVEFPELSRILADQGMKILFVPYQTDTQNGYSRVRLCSQARAIENECYVAISGSVGNLPKVFNMDIQYSQAAVFTPSDFSFPTNGINTEATPNTEMVVIADLDTTLLKTLHSYGSVRNLKDRRKDLYRLELIDSKKDAKAPALVEV